MRTLHFQGCDLYVIKIALVARYLEECVIDFTYFDNLSFNNPLIRIFESIVTNQTRLSFLIKI